MGQEWVSVTGEEKHSSSWVVDVEKMLEDDNPGSRSTEEQRWKAQSIYLVPEWLKGTNNKSYQPQGVSLGPFHHGAPNLHPMEEHKRRALVHLIKRSKRTLGDFISAIDEVAEELQAAYGKDLHVKWRNDRRRFVEMMLTDGCFLLEIMKTIPDYELHDPVFCSDGRYQIEDIIRPDMLLIENQLPLLVLKKILGVLPPGYLDQTDIDISLMVVECLALEHENHESLDIVDAFESHLEVEMDRKINLMVLKFLGRGHEGCGIANTKLRLHPLELYHGSLIYKEGDREVREESQQCEYETMPSVLKMHEAGIKFSESKRDNLLYIDFKGAVLTMPMIVVHDDTESLYLNLMALERLHFGVGNLVTAYVSFMDDMIVSAKNVAMLSSNRVLHNVLGCDEEVAKLFNGTLNRGQLRHTIHDLRDVQSDVNAYCKKSCHKWRATLIRTYFRNPWAFISLAVATILLIATLLQTVYTVKSNKS